MRKLITMLGSPLDTLSMSEAIDRMIDFAANGRTKQKYHQVATVNVDFLVKSTSDPELRGILQSVDMATIDGMPLVWGGRCLGADIPQRVAGSDFVPLLIQRAAQEGLSIFLLGATPDVSFQAAKIMQEQNPDLIIAGVHSPPFRPVLEMDPNIIDEIKTADPDILLVAFGNPKQEKWIDAYGPQVRVPLMVGIGATLDFIAGEMKRAPGWMQRIGLEWLFRMLQEPRRLFKRYFKDMYIFGAYFFRQWWLQHPRSVDPSQLHNVSLHNQGQLPIIKFQGELTKEDYQAIWDLGKQALSVSDNLSLDLKDCTFIDSPATGALMGLIKQAHDQGGEVWIAAISPQVQKILSFHNPGTLVASAVPSHSGSDHTEEEPGVLDTQLHGLKTHLVNEAGNDWLIVKAPRRLDGRTSLNFKQAFNRIAVTHQLLVLDLSDTFYVSSGGLVVMDKLTHQTETRQGQLIITNASPDVTRVFKIHKYHKKLNIYPDFSTAMEE